MPPNIITFLCAAGLALSAYSLYVEYNMKQAGPGLYKAACDINSFISCTRAFSSPFGHVLFGLPNSLFGLGFYPVLLLAVRLNQRPIASLLAVASSLFSVFLIGALIYLRDICVVCIAVHIVNFSLLFLILTGKTTTNKPEERRK